MFGYSDNAPKREGKELKKGYSPLTGSPRDQMNTGIVSSTMFNMMQLKRVSDKGNAFQTNLYSQRASYWGARYRSLNGNNRHGLGHMFAQLLFGEVSNEKLKPVPDPEKIVRLNRRDKKKK